MKNVPEISFVIPAKDEQESLPVLYRKIVATLNNIGQSFEIIIIDDGSNDNTFQIAKNLHLKDKRVKAIKLRGWFGKSIALQTGFEYASGKIVFTLDADLQDDPKEIPNFLIKLNEGYDLVSGWKKKRHDPLGKTLPSKIGNFLTRLLTGVKIHDLNCGFKCYRREVVTNLNLYGELYKYIPVLAEKQNFRVGEIIVSHNPRKYGKSKFGPERNVKGLLDMITIFFLTGYMKKPGHFFGTIGFMSFFFGFLIGLYITYLRITTGGIQYRQPLLFLGILLMIVGIHFFSTGLIAELITSFNQQKLHPDTIITEKLI